MDLGIISDGVLRCIGPQVRLKSLYGNGYHLFVNCHKERYIDQILQRGEEGNELIIREEKFYYFEIHKK